MNAFLSCLKTYNLPKPGRYINTEFSQKHQQWRKDVLKVLLAFPDVYEIGTSYLGFFLLYNYLLNDNHILLDRVFAPDRTIMEFLQSQKQLLPSLYFQKPGKEYDCIGFTLQTELSCTTIVKMIELSGIPVLSSKRNSAHPIILCGGAGTYNPEPYSEFIDAFIIGDGEEVFKEIVSVLKKNIAQSRKQKLLSLSGISGVYVPEFYKPEYNNSKQFAGFTIKKEAKERIKKRVFDINRSPLPKWYLVPSIKPVHDRLVVEATRGCLNACRFCQAGYINRPLREKNTQRICDEVLRGLTQTGYNEVSLLALSIANYSRLSDIIQTLSPFLKQYHVNLSFPSLRMEKFSSHLEAPFLPRGKSGFTFAPEAGTEKLRYSINKNISDQEILETIKLAFSRGWQVLKLYFMIGLPDEEETDIEGILSLIYKAERMGRKYHGRYQVNVSLSPFIPKSHTPFQWSRHFEESYYREIISYIRKQCRKLKNVSIKYPDLTMNRVEAFLARADRRASEVILEAVKAGAYLDTWDDDFRSKIWQELLGNFTDKYNYNISQPYTTNASLPWDIIDSRVKKDFLLTEMHKAKQSDMTFNCLEKRQCHNCGACNNPLQDNITASKEKISPLPHSRLLDSPPKSFRYWFLFTKHFPAAFTGHLDYIRNIEYILRRAHLPLLFTEGFRPKIKISFYDALPIFWESDCEIMEIPLSESIDSDTTLKNLNHFSVAGIQFRRILTLPLNTPHLNKQNIVSRYHISFESNSFNKMNSFQELSETDSVRVHRISAGIMEIDVAGKKKQFRTLLDEYNIPYTVHKKHLLLTHNNKELIL